MTRDSWRLTLFSLLWHSIVLVACVRADTKSEFVKLINDRIPRAGAVHVVFRAGSGVGEVACGLDAGSGAWYRIDEYAVKGQDCLSRGFAGPPGFLQVKDVDFGYAGSNMCLDNLIPVALLIDIAKRTDLIHEVERVAGGYLVDIEFPSGVREEAPEPAGGRIPPPKPSHLWLRTDEDGVVQYMSHESGEDAMRGKAVVRSPAVPAIMAPLADCPTNPWKVLSCTYEQTADCDKFDRSFVVAAAVEMRVRLKKEIADMDSGKLLPLGPPGSAGAGVYDPATDPSSRGISLGVGVVGGVMVVLGVAAWTRSRKLAPSTK